uniref:PH domain-containing protein n=1 Tax=Panagrellus redivivus TaxID=6233 RepID=A0A7E4VHY6_PANRE
MLANGRSLAGLVNNKSYDRSVSGKLFFLQDDRWRQTYAVLKANLLFFFESETQTDSPIFLLIVEDCTIELSDDNLTGKPYSFAIRLKSTKRVFQLAATDFDSLGNWISYLTVCSVDYITATKQMFLEEINSRTNETESSPGPSS